MTEKWKINGKEKEWLWRHSHSFIFACGDCSALAGYVLGWRHPWNILLTLSYTLGCVLTSKMREVYPQIRYNRFVVLFHLALRGVPVSRVTGLDGWRQPEKEHVYECSFCLARNVFCFVL